MRGVYPRVCGGTVVIRSSVMLNGGLSPRVRGNRGGSSTARSTGRSIPACAGEPPRPGAGAVNYPVYPRVCGGTQTTRGPPHAHMGLSPRVRGNRVVYLLVIGVDGSIPACAGEPEEISIGGGADRVYPRVCGGTAPALPLGAGQVGLSPRVRGNPQPGPVISERTGSIPACAGEPSAEYRCRSLA